MTDITTSEPEVSDQPALPPEEPSLPIGEWTRKNLFSSPGNAILTVVFSVLVLAAFRVLVNFMFENPERDWVSIKFNMRLLFAHAYPVSQFSRVWASLGMVVGLGALSLALWPGGGVKSIKRISTSLMSAGGIIALGTLMVNGALSRDDAGEVLFTEDFEAIRDSWASSLGGRGSWFLLAALLFGAGLALWVKFGDQRRSVFVPTVRLLYVTVGLLIASLWVVKYGHYGVRGDGTFVIKPDSLVAFSTRMPLTVLFVLAGLIYLVGVRLRGVDAVKIAVTAGWALSPFIAFWVILRDPDIDYTHVFNTDLPMFVAFAVFGGALLYALSSPKIGELGRLIAMAMVGVAGFTFVSAFFGWISMLQKARLSFVALAVFALMANNFTRDLRTRRNFVIAWVVAIGVMHYFITIMNSASTLELRSDTIVGGFVFTIFAAVFGLMFSFPLGVLLALARTSTLPIFRLLATWFIEFVRGVPFITVLFFFDIMLPLFLPEGMEAPGMAATVLGLVLFSAAYLAENVRGGLQSVRRGQFEAADALGLTTPQRTMFIVLPQSLRVSIPPLVGQAIATYKETSLFAIIGVFDFLRIANSVIPNQSTPVNFVGHKLEGLLFISLVYWLGTFTMSKYSQSLEKKLGVGDR